MVDIAILHQKQLVAQNNNYSFSTAGLYCDIEPTWSTWLKTHIRRDAPFHRSKLRFPPPLRLYPVWPVGFTATDRGRGGRLHLGVLWQKEEEHHCALRMSEHMGK